MERVQVSVCLYFSVHACTLGFYNHISVLIYIECVFDQLKVQIPLILQYYDVL